MNSIGYDYLNEFLLITSKRKKRNEYKEAVLFKNIAGRRIFNQLCHEWCGRFIWNTKEKTIASEMIERTILFHNAVAFAKVNLERIGAIGEVWANCIPANVNNLSFYGRATSIELIDYVGRNLGTYIPVMREFPVEGIENCALVRDNFDDDRPIMSIMYYAKRMLDVDTSIRGCIKNITGTAIIYCTPEQKLMIEKQRSAAEIGVPYVICIDESNVSQIPPSMICTQGAAEELKTLYECMDKVHGDFLQSIGIRVNNEMDRRSGITPIEIVENRQNIDISLNSYLNSRKKGIEECKEIGLEINVSLDNMEPKTGAFDSNGNIIKTGEGGSTEKDVDND